MTLAEYTKHCEDAEQQPVSEGLSLWCGRFRQQLRTARWTTPALAAEAEALAQRFKAVEDRCEAVLHPAG